MLTEMYRVCIITRDTQNSHQTKYRKYDPHNKLQYLHLGIHWKPFVQTGQSHALPFPREINSLLYVMPTKTEGKLD